MASGESSSYPSVLFLPHAESTPIRLGASYRSTMDLRLTPEGEEAAMDFGEKYQKAWLADLNSKKAARLTLAPSVVNRAKENIQVFIASSPLQRCRDTAHFISNGFGFTDTNVELHGLLSGQGLIDLNMRIKFAHEGAIRTTNKIISGEERICRGGTLEPFAQVLLHNFAYKLEVAADLKTETSVNTKWICVSEPFMLALFLAHVFELIEFTEKTWPQPLEPVLIQCLDDSEETVELRVSWRKRTRDIALTDITRYNSSTCGLSQQCCSLM